ncbi:G-alpha-domain-containing protein [Rickenella mellea]|uniref:G-alpha-domain-containing protein n=1 Tax=Rickenella mellea TaxID=50990 RepID=A0A4Y7QCL5_9AGAM|nr:G-alpha-domain-containing protein [Rickenella mellea]
MTSTATSLLYTTMMHRGGLSTISYRRPTDASWPPPPEHESSEDARIRVELEREARRVNDEINRAIDRERIERKRKKPDVKIMLLGQAESGKSTTLKNFQLNFAPNVFRAEAEAWRLVIHLNLVRSVNYIVDLLTVPARPQPPESGKKSTSRPGSANGNPPTLSTELRRLKLSLGPLKNIEAVLSRRLTAEPYATSSAPCILADSVNFGTPTASVPCYPLFSELGVRVRSNSDWKRNRGQQEFDTKRQQRELEDAHNIIAACGSDINALWRNRDVQSLLKRNGVSSQDQSGFFLPEALRVTAKDYIPSNEDVLRARLSTIGVEEHRLRMEHGQETGQEWIMYDCGGARSQRVAWAQFFDDINAIIFLAPASGFNETLSEDPSVNRLDDTMQLWRSVCSNRLLGSVEIMLFLNKMDVLREKLRHGTRFSQYVPTFNDENGKKNDIDSVSRYLFTTFLTMHKLCAPEPSRKVYLHRTCVIDQRATSKVLNHVREVLVLGHLSESSLI